MDTREAMIARLRRQPVVVLSPHYDDACLSIGGILSALGTGTLVNIFTRSLFLKNVPPGRPRNEEQVHLVREAEDRAFCTHAGLSRHDLGCFEPPVVGRHSSDRSHLEEDVAQASAPVLSKLTELARSQSRSFLFAPLGIGPNVNHLAMAQIIWRNLAKITEGYDLLFYEEQPYAARPFERRRALRRMRGATAAQSAKRHAFPIGWKAKEALIAFYPSQFPSPVSRMRFRPAVMAPLGFHEAFWSIDKELI